MGFLNLFSKAKPELLSLPTGSFSVDRGGAIVSSTLPHSFPPEHVKYITNMVLGAFKEAQAARLPMAEMVIDYSSLKITAKEQRGGAMIFVAPHGPSRQM